MNSMATKDGTTIYFKDRLGPAVGAVQKIRRERLHYDWSNPNHVVLTTTDSNMWGGGSGHEYTFTRHADGTTDIDVVVPREGKNLKGYLLGFVPGTIGKGVLEKAFANSIKAIEARNKEVQANAA